MKLRIISIAALAAIAGQAQALTVAQVNDAATVNVYVSGASATKAVIKGLFVQNCLQTTPGTYDDLTIFSSKQGTTAGQGDSANGASYNSYTCTLKTGNDFGTTFNGKKVAFHKRDRDGSGMGVFPVAQNIAINFQEISAASCDEAAATTAADGTKTVLCSNLTAKKPDGGTSDVEPTMFLASANLPSFGTLSPAEPTSFTPAAGFTGTGATGTAFQSGSPRVLFQTPFVLAVSQKLYTDLQTAQGTSGQPSIPYALASALLRSGPSYGNAWKALNLANAGSQVTICRREAGSGTQAASNMYFGNYPLTLINPLAAGDTTATVTLTGSGAVDLANAGNFTQAGTLLVVENTSSGNVRSCLTAANTAGAYAVGHISAEAGLSGSGWNTVKIDGATPNRTNVQNGNYDYWFESTCQVNKFAGGAATAATNNNQKTFLNAFCQQASLPKNLASLGAAGSFPRSAISALPNGASPSGTFDGCAAVASYPATTSDLVNGSSSVTVTADQVEFCGRMSRSGNSTNLPIIYK
jgi:hypothetical protein